MKHTPGPWHRPGGSTGIYAQDGTMIASCGDKRIVASMRQHGHNPLQCAANADLMAKAPELLETVERLLACLSWPTAKDAREHGHPIPSYCPYPGTTVWDICEAADNLVTGLRKGQPPDKAIPDLLEAAVWVLRSAGYENGEALPTLHELTVGRHHLDRLRAAVQKAKDCTLKQAPA